MATSNTTFPFDQIFPFDIPTSFLQEFVEKECLKITNQSNKNHKLYLNINEAFALVNDGFLDGIPGLKEKDRFKMKLEVYLAAVRKDNELDGFMKTKLMTDLLDVISYLQFPAFMLNWKGKLEHLLLIKPNPKEQNVEDNEDGNDEDKEDDIVKDEAGKDVFARVNSIFIKLNNGVLDHYDVSRVLKIQFVHKLTGLREEIESSTDMDRVKKYRLKDRIEKLIEDISTKGFFLHLRDELNDMIPVTK
jgi:hypothetical protein